MEPEKFQESFKGLEAEVRKVIVGHDDTIRKVLIAFFAGGHVLLEGVPGLGKTLLVKTLSHALGVSFKRIQFTPDLMPSDIVGTQVLAEINGRREFQFKQGPIFAHVVLADEINRATPKTQSAVLEAMEEKQVTVFGESHIFESPFHGSGHAKSHRAGRYLSVTRGSARSIFFQTPGDAADSSRTERDPEANYRDRDGGYARSFARRWRQADQ